MFRTNGKFLGLLRHLRTPILFHFCDASDNLKLAGLALKLCALRLAHRSRWPTCTKAAKQSWGNLLCGAARVTASQEWPSLEIMDFVNKAWHRVFPCIWRLRLYPNYAPVAPYSRTPYGLFPDCFEQICTARHGARDSPVGAVRFLSHCTGHVGM